MSTDEQRPEDVDVDTAVELGLAKLEVAQQSLEQNNILKAIYYIKWAGLYFERAPQNHAKAIFGRGMQHALLGETLRINGKNEQAMRHWIAASKFLNRLSGELARKNLRNTLERTGEAAASIGSYEQALLSFKNLYKLDTERKTDPNTLVNDLNNIAVLLKRLGRLEEADSCLENAEGLIAKGGVHLKTEANHLYNRALVLNQLGFYDKAIEYHQKSIRKFQALPGTEKVRAEVLLDLSIALNDTGKKIPAIKHLETAYELVKNRPDSKLISLKIQFEYMNLVESKTDPKGYVQKLQELLVKAQTIPGTEELRLLGLNNLGIAWRDAGQDEKSIAAFNEALALLEEHSIRTDYASQIYKNLGVVFATQRKPDLANAQFIQSLQIEIRNLAADLPGLTDMAKYSRINSKYALIADSIHTVSFDYPSYSGFHGLQAALWTKALYSETCRSEHPMFQWSKDSEHSALVEEYHELRRRISKRFLEKSNGTANEQVERDLTLLASRLRQVELALRGDPDVFREEYRFKIASVEAVRANLAPGEALLEFILYKPPNSPFSEEREPQYGAYVLVGGKEETWAIPMGPASHIDDAILAYRATLESQLFYDADDEINLRRLGKTVRELLFDPIFSTTKGINRIYIAPDGLIGLFPFEVMPSLLGGQQYLLEEMEIVYITSGRDLVAGEKIKTQDAGKSAWLVGDPAYNASEQQRIAALAKASSGPIGKPRANQLSEDKSSSGWKRLSYTRKMIQKVSSVTKKAGIPTSVLLDAAASEESLWSLESPRILVLATHGHFQRNAPPIHMVFSSKAGVGKFNEDFFETINPLQYSMMVLAGANRPPNRVEGYLINDQFMTEKQLRQLPKGPRKTELLKREMGDGFLSAYEVLGMNLQDTELVVLLGCETGLGVSQGGETFHGLQQPGNEGVAGLRQAFRVAGAESLIMSMWKVPEEDSVRQIETFFYGWLFGRKSRYHAFHAAQLKALNDARKIRNSGHPFWWGGFIYYGQPDDPVWKKTN